MGILKNSKSFLEYMGKDATLLSITILILYIENVYYYSYEKSLITDNPIEIEKVLQFRFIVGFVVFLFISKFLFVLYWHLINIFLLHRINIPVSYKVGFGAFTVGLLLVYHVHNTDNSNMFVQAISYSIYYFICAVFIVFALLIAGICNWTGNNSKS